MSDETVVAMKAVTWGKEFTRLLTTYCIPSLLAKGNLPHKSQDLKYRLVIYAPKEDQSYIMRQPSFHMIKDIIPCSFHTINPPPDGVLKHNHMNAAHRHMLERSILHDEGIVFLLPDQVISTGTFRYIDECVGNGQSIVMIPGLRISYEGVEIEQDLQSYKGNFTPTEAVDLFVKHMHPMSQGCFWNSRYFSSLPTHVYHWDGKRTITGRVAHMHPFFMLNPKGGTGGTIDSGGYMGQYYDLSDRIAVPSEVVQLSLTEDAKSPHWMAYDGEPTSEEVRVNKMRSFLKSQQPIETYFMSKDIVYKGSRFNKSKMIEQIKPVAGITKKSFDELF